MQGAALEEEGKADAGTVVDGKSLNVKKPHSVYELLFHSVTEPSYR